MREAGACSFHTQMACERSNPTVRGAAVYESDGLSSGRGKHKGGALSRIGVTFLILGAIVMAASTLGECRAAQAKGLPKPVAAHPASITIDYPLDGSYSLLKSPRQLSSGATTRRALPIGGSTSPSPTARWGCMSSPPVSG